MSDKSPPRSADPKKPADGGPLRVGEIIERLPLDRQQATSTRTPPSRNRSGRVITGRLTDHGRANYQFETHGSPSYYVQILSSRGAETLWGVDLECAIAQSRTQPKIGAMVGVQRIGSE